MTIADSVQSSDPAQLGAAELSRAIAAGQLRPSEVVEAFIARIQALQPALNAVVYERFDEARREAREADQRVRAGGELPALCGVPITLKDSIDLAGAPSTFGVERLRAPVARDAAVVRRLREAGAIVLAKSNAAQLLLFFETDNPVFGRTLHPHAPERSAGGSSGGEAALIARCASPLGFGTDLGGSVRVPAAFCGIAGFKPTAGRLMDDGRFSIPPGQTAITSQIGALARSVEDLALGLRVAFAPEGDDGRGPLLPYSDVSPNGLRVAVLEDDGILQPCPAARRAVREAAAALSGAGAQLVQVALPSRTRLYEAFYAVMSADGLAHARATLGGSKVDPRIKGLLDGARLPRPLTELMLRATSRRRLLDVVRCFSDGSASAYFATVEKLAELRAQALDAMRGADAVLSPACALPALRHGASAELGTMGSYTAAWNVLGWPAGVVPWTQVRQGEESDRPITRDVRDRVARETERGSAGLPIAVQIAAAPHRDHVALGVLRALEQLRGA
jgi:fatty acid amide hydrolase